MQLKLTSLFGRRPGTDDDPDEDVSVAYDPDEDLVESPPPQPAKTSKGRGRNPDAPRLTSPMKWALSRVANHVTFSDKRMVAWYLLDPQRWSFRTVADGESLIEAHASQVAELVGRTVYGRITTRPYAVETWAEAAWNNSPATTEEFAKSLEREGAPKRSFECLYASRVAAGGRSAQSPIWCRARGAADRKGR
ncbi:hypothetical protein [uncultured Cellulomonas sp.]|uniref:hypothetical protein n=1 Tax=uncultured Cellulomonas sp. TaxID=189682 RepID=UPI0028EDA7CD|nr:hypothetical protein [uncultured Cellulomonas sp.]